MRSQFLPIVTMGRGTIERRFDGGEVRDASANYPSTMLCMVPLPSLRLGRNDLRRAAETGCRQSAFS